MDNISKVKILTAATATGAGDIISDYKGKAAFQVTGATSAGAGAAAIAIQGSLDGTNWVTLGTISLTLSTTDATDGFVIDAPWDSVRANVSSISGTDASVDCWMGYEV